MQGQSITPTRCSALGDDREVWDPCVLALQGSELLDYHGVRKDMGQHYLFTEEVIICLENRQTALSSTGVMRKPALLGALSFFLFNH